MLSYRHGFHAGNHADVLKHLVLVSTLAHLNRKEGAYWVVDTHAGAGQYDLRGPQAEKLGEFRDGIGRLWGRDDLPAPLADYLAQVLAANPDGRLARYPGSPWLAARALRAQDRLRLFELHSSEVPALQACFRGAGRQVKVTAGDGFTGLKALLPPPSRRGLVLIDPSYETRADYGAVLQALKDGLARFATGIFAVWYPLLARTEARDLPGRLRHLPARRWLDVSLSVAPPRGDGLGMQGSGMFIVNPPWTLEAELRQCLPFLAATLGQEGAGRFSLDSREEKGE
ncbi:MAG: 23S rRNA (adenine(2030)-N(6))-methyltransferase RlmJ [Azonexus sp.]|nr:23S rRNA (adenine(2030)-N(6))-methyltransferase RlmJ [Betaproteobacteria bacterium]MBK8918268.1 23S rRNA (adenine(2030)-N(6))-methyltransferase RlmJ [Betaproteobacteria bacterium]MBP6036182.1 23S rRNA (adenine(2030)-N(6))-methyltransferase RlmJ [Azonexus sp.]MBP6906705.1 23S rRNA (adenine(2030)-N(6))-methyltransferase RlmJ [Azonexus sp.]